MIDQTGQRSSRLVVEKWQAGESPWAFTRGRVEAIFSAQLRVAAVDSLLVAMKTNGTDNRPPRGSKQKRRPAIRFVDAATICNHLQPFEPHSDQRSPLSVASAAAAPVAEPARQHKRSAPRKTFRLRNQIPGSSNGALWRHKRYEFANGSMLASGHWRLTIGHSILNSSCSRLPSWPRRCLFLAAPLGGQLSAPQNNGAGLGRSLRPAAAPCKSRSVDRVRWR